MDNYTNLLLPLSIFLIFILLLISVYQPIQTFQISDISKKYDEKTIIISANLTKLNINNKKTFLELTDTKYENNKITAIINSEKTKLKNYINQTIFFQGKLSFYDKKIYLYPEKVYQ